MLLLTIAAAAAAAQPAEGLKPLDFVVGHCWAGTFANGQTDTHCFESVYGGKHIRDRHEVTGGKSPYRGESLYSWDAKSGAVAYTYWNILGGVSHGAMRANGDVLDFGRETYRGPDGELATMKTSWRRIDADSFEWVTQSSEIPSLNRTVTFRRLAPKITMTSERDSNGATTLVHEALVPAPAAEVWAAVDTAPGWTGWAVPVAWRDADLLETSYTASASRGDPTTIQQRILATVPQRLIVFRTVKAPAGFPHFDSFARVTHVIELEPAGENATRVRLTGTGYPDTDAGRQLLAFFTDGNRVSLERLQRRFTTGPIDWAAETASARPKGK